MERTEVKMNGIVVVDKDGWLSDEALINIRKDIVLDSVYVSDYENRYGVDPQEVCNFMEGYGDYLIELMNEDGKDGNNDYFELRSEYDNYENLISWYHCFGFNPFNTEEIGVKELENVA